MNVLFDPIELGEHRGEPVFRIGQAQGNLGALLPSANNLRTTLDPSNAETRLIKEAAMPLCEAMAHELPPDQLPSFVRDAVDPRMGGRPWSGDPMARAEIEQRQAAALFPFLESITIRTMLERVGVKS